MSLESQPVDAPPVTDEDAPLRSFERVEEFKWAIQGGLLDNLGIKMYTKIGKVLVEFAANAYDSDSPAVDIDFDLDAIHKARAAVLAQAREQAKTQTGSAARKARIADDPLPEGILVVIRDSGHGMTPQELLKSFLPLNRNRRRNRRGEEVKTRTESGKRAVMGRKGIGKLAAFGAANLVRVRSKRKDQPFWTQIEMRTADMLAESDLTSVPLPHTYLDAKPEEIGVSGTIVELGMLRSNSAGFLLEDIKSVLQETFYPIKPGDFAIRINGQQLEKEAPVVKYTWPEDIKKDELKTETLKGEDWGEIDFRYRVQFRDKSLRAEKRGAYIYAKNRLAMEPSLLDLDTGVHNFMAHAYMECIVESDDIDNLNLDVIGTNRSAIMQNNDLVSAFRARITAIMQEALKHNAAFKEKDAEDAIQKRAEAKMVRDLLQVVPESQRGAARQLAKLMIAQYGVDSEAFQSVAPLIVGTANAGAVLVDLINASVSPSTVQDIAEKLVRLREIERSDALKLYQGRRNGIIALRKLIEEGEANWNKGPHTEKALHRLLKESPWLIRPELSDYLASDQTLNQVLYRLSADLKIDMFAPEAMAIDEAAILAAKDTEQAEVDAMKRPDLVALLSNPAVPERVLIIELKSTALPLRIQYLTQLEEYMTAVDDYLRREFPGRQVAVDGILIGAMPGDRAGLSSMTLMKRIRERGPETKWEVVGLNELLVRTEAAHREMIATLKKEEAENS